MQYSPADPDNLLYPVVRDPAFIPYKRVPYNEVKKDNYYILKVYDEAHGNRFYFGIASVVPANLYDDKIYLEILYSKEKPTHPWGIYNRPANKYAVISESDLTTKKMSFHLPPWFNPEWSLSNNSTTIPNFVLPPLTNELSKTYIVDEPLSTQGVKRRKQAMMLRIPYVPINGNTFSSSPETSTGGGGAASSLTGGRRNRRLTNKKQNRRTRKYKLTPLKNNRKIL